MIDLKKELDPEIKKDLRKIYSNDLTKYKTIMEIFGNLLADNKDLKKFEELAKSRSFKKYLKDNINISIQRFESTLIKIGKKLVSHSSSNVAINIINTLNSKEYIDCLKIYFIPPPSYELFDKFETMTINIAEVNPDLCKILFELSEKRVLINIKYYFLSFGEIIYENFIIFLERLILNTKDKDYIFLIFNKILSTKFIYFIKLFVEEEIKSKSGNTEKYVFDKDGIKIFFHILYDLFITLNKNKVEDFFSIIYSPYLKTNVTANFIKKEKKVIILKIISLMILILNKIEKNDFINFIKNYPYRKSSGGTFLWETLFDCEDGEKCVKMLLFFNSIGFINFYNSYLYYPDILSFLLKNILYIIKEIEIKDFPKNLFPVILELFLKQKVDKSFLRKRSDFIKYLEEKTKSEMVNSVFIRIFFYEYIFLFQKKFEKENYSIKLTRYCDSFHEKFCKMLDVAENIKIKEHSNKEEKIEKVYKKIWTMGREIAWQPIFERFSDKNKLTEIFNIVESVDGDDIAIKEMLKVKPEYFLKYYYKLMEVVRKDPNRFFIIREALFSDYWCRFYFDKAFPFISDALLFLIGVINVYPNDKTGPATNGKDIFMPSYVSFFLDDPDDVDNNRNLSLYISFSLHEAGHIVGGSFKFDIKSIIEKLEYPQLFKNIFNCFEDYRIERYLKKIKAHPQVEDLLDSMDIYFSSSGEFSLIDEFLIHIIDKAAGYWDKIVKINPEKEKSIEKILKMGLSTGRFSNLTNMRDYFVERLINLDIVNPFSLYFIVDEMYHIIKNWPLDLIEDANHFLGMNNLPFEGKFEFEEEGGEEKNIPAQRKILTEEELKKLYDECNANPEKFYEDNGLKVFPELFDDEKNENNSSEEGIKNDIMKNLGFIQNIDYEAEGTFDVAHHTKVDEEIAKQQKNKASLSEQIKEMFDKITRSKEKDKKEKKGEKSKKERKPKRKVIRTYSSNTRTKSVLTECFEYEINSINRKFLAENRKYNHIIQKIYTILNNLFINAQCNITENSTIEGEIDIERLIEILSDRKNFYEADFLEYYVENFKSLRVIIGLDTSGSTAATLKSGQTVLDIEKHFALIFAKSLKMLTNKVDIYAFNSMTSTNIYHLVPIEAVSSLVSDWANRDGDFIRYIKEILKRSKEELKYFFLITDGMPSSPNYEGRSALDDTILALRECRKDGIKVVYFNIDSFLREYFYEFKNEVVYAEHFVHPEEIIDIVPDLVKSIAKEIM